MVFHVLNKGVGRMQLFRANKGYDAFRRVLEETLRVAPMRICAYCLLPNHGSEWTEHAIDMPDDAVARIGLPEGLGELRC